MTDKDKFAVITKLQSELDYHVWDIFNQYIEEEGILFNSPDSWSIDEDGCNIEFVGSDGCMGCYDSMSLTISLDFFINSTELKELKRSNEIRRNKEKSYSAYKRKNDDRALYNRLKKEFGNDQAKQNKQA